MPSNVFGTKGAGYAAGMLGIAAVTAIGAPFHDTLNDTTVALAYLLVVLFVATAWGSWPALMASVVGVLCFNFFFLPPVYTLTIADPQNWVALAAFFVTAVTAGQLSELAKRRAAEAEAVRRETRLASAHRRSLLEASLDALVTIGTDGKIDDVNSAIETLTGRSRAALIGTDFSDVLYGTGARARRLSRGASRRLCARSPAGASPPRRARDLRALQRVTPSRCRRERDRGGGRGPLDLNVRRKARRSRWRMPAWCGA